MHYKEQLAVIKSLDISGEIDTRMDCPFCYHPNSFILKNENGKLSWYCFHASCDVRGTLQQEKTMDDIEAFLSLKKVQKDFTIPKHFTLPTERVEKYLTRNNCYDAYTKGLVKIRYDVKQDRVVFLVSDKNKIVSAIGRGLSKDVYPKWYKYPTTFSAPFICGKHKTAIVVEDCASACAVSEHYTGFALMGTSFSDDFIPYIKKYSKVIIALDRDATTKSFDIANQIGYYVPTEVKVLEDDLKYFKSNEIKEILT